MYIIPISFSELKVQSIVNSICMNFVINISICKQIGIMETFLNTLIYRKYVDFIYL